MNRALLAAFAIAAVCGSASASVIEFDVDAGVPFVERNGSARTKDAQSWAPTNPGWHMPETYRYWQRADQPRFQALQQTLYPHRDLQCGVFPGEHTRSVCFHRDGMQWFEPQR